MVTSSTIPASEHESIYFVCLLQISGVVLDETIGEKPKYRLVFVVLWCGRRDENP